MKELLQRAIQINEELGAKLKELKDLEEPNLLGADGKYFTAKIEDIKCKGRVRVEGGEVYLCQDSNKGDSCNDKLGYRYSWRVSNLTYNGVLDLKLWDYLPKEGDYIYVKTKEGNVFIAIAENGEYLTNRFVSLDQNYGRLNYDELGFVCSELSIKELRSATTEEIDLLDTKLKENGKYFDQATMSIKDIVNEPAFKVGDWVLIKKPKDVRQNPTWTYWSSRMDRYDGQTLEIEEFDSDGYLVIDDWGFNPDWCTKVEAPKPNKPEVGDICIFWDDNKSNAIIGKLTSIDKSAYPYGVAFISDYKNCIKFESMEQYNKFIAE